MKLIDRLVRPPAESRSSLQDIIAAWASKFWSTGGNSYEIVQSYANTTKDRLFGSSDASMFVNAYTGNSVVFACMAFRASVFSEARFQYQQLRGGRPGNLFGTPDLAILEQPWPDGTTGDLLALASVTADIAGNFYAVRDGDVLNWLRPDWVQIVLDRPAEEYGARKLGIAYFPGGPNKTRPEDATTFLSREVLHWAPKPDPLWPWRGMSPLQPLISEIEADHAATQHKARFFDNNATANMVITLDPMTSFENFLKYKEDFRDDHEGAANAYKTVFLGGGADAKVVGADMRQLDFKNTQGAGETRIAAALEVAPVLVGLSEGLQSATYSNYGMARRRYADATERPRWRSFAAAAANVVAPQREARLWYDEYGIAFLREDAKDDAEIHQLQAVAMRQLVDAGFRPSTVVDAVTSGDYQRLEHTGLYSVQLQPPGASLPATSTN